MELIIMYRPKRTFYLIVVGCKCQTNPFDPWVSIILSNNPKRNKYGVKCPYCHCLILHKDYGQYQTIRAISQSAACIMLHGHYN